jgi:hypothetical protein
LPVKNLLTAVKAEFDEIINDQTFLFVKIVDVPLTFDRRFDVKNESHQSLS